MKCEECGVEPYLEYEDCRHCDGTGIDDDELDGSCVSCIRGEVRTWVCDCQYNTEDFEKTPDISEGG